MREFWRQHPDVGNAVISEQIRNEISAALQAIRSSPKGLVVNDTIWYWKNPEGNIKPTVVNSAKFITGHFQNYLETSVGWTQEMNLLGQTVDAYKEFPGEFRMYVLPEKKLPPLLERYEAETGESLGPLATALYIKYCQKGAPALESFLDPFLPFFDNRTLEKNIRVAIEFETGNIASSFRAANKLDYLYRNDLIDLGIFITSNDKPNCAARIWPVTNRNGSFQELERRGFARGLSVPLWTVGFQPDDFESSAPYLGDDGQLYSMEPLNEPEIIADQRYEIW